MTKPGTKSRDFSLRPAATFAALLCAIILTGCSALPVALPFALPIVVSGAGGGVAYTVTNVAYQTFSHPLADVEAATHDALKKMAIDELTTEDTEDGRRITAFTTHLNIYIDLERVTPAATKVKVNAKRGSVMKDKATATEIIRQVYLILEPTNMSRFRGPGI